MNDASDNGDDHNSKGSQLGRDTFSRDKLSSGDLSRDNLSSGDPGYQASSSRDSESRGSIGFGQVHAAHGPGTPRPAMMGRVQVEPPAFRLWIVRCADWRPGEWNQIPPRATAHELYDDALYSAETAANHLEGFNSRMLALEESLWLVAVPVTLRYEGDAQVGRPVHGFDFDRRPGD